jgi:two-component sensor histidine kinase
MSVQIIEERVDTRRGAYCDDQTMAREAYHRVSNHLQILASLINLEARQRPGGEATEALLGVRRRILAIAHLQSELQRIGEEGMIDVAALLNRLSGDLRLCFDADRSDVLEVSADAGFLPAETAATVVLIINELVTNSLKYAVLPEGGRIRVRLGRQDDELWRLSVSDDGPGIPEGALSKPSDHGLELVRRLAGKIRGALDVHTAERGAAVSVSFPCVVN